MLWQYAHNTDANRAFLPASLQKVVKQYNAVHGDKPKNPIPDFSPRPRPANFNHKTGPSNLSAEKKNMEVIWDATDSSIISSDTDGVDFDVADEEPLELHAVSTCAELSDTMDKIANDLEQSILANKLDVNPRYAVMDVKKIPSVDKPASAPSPIQDRSNLISMSDYDIYI